MASRQVPGQLFLLLFVLAGCAHVEPGREVLRELSIEGNETLSDAAIEERLALTETPFWPWADPYYFDQGTLTGDRRRLLRFYQANGFYEARVRSRVRRENGDVRVTLVVEEGPPTLLERLDISGLEGLPAEVREAVLGEPLPLRVGERITEADWDATRTALVERLWEQGYGDAETSGTVEVDPDRRVAVASIEVRPGERLHFGRVVITGAVDVPRARILEEVRRATPGGSPYSAKGIAEAEANLVGLGVFGGVRVSRGPTDPATRTVPLLVSVSEAPFQTVRAGAGVGFDNTSFTARVLGGYVHRNFLGGLRTLRFENVLGYSILTGKLGEVQARGVVGSSAVEFVQPNLIRTIDLNLRVAYERGLESAYRYDVVRGRIGFPIELHRTLVFVPSYNLQRFWLYETTATEGSGGNCQSTEGDCVLAFLEERIVWDLRDHPIETRSGWYTSLALQQGRPWLGSQANYDRVLGEIRRFQPLPGDWVLALKLEGGVLLPRTEGDSPITERFYAGGGSSVRAFGTRRLSPQVPDDDGDGTVPVGGDALLEAIAELRIPLAGALGMAVFVDAGNVSRTAGAQGLDQLLSPNVSVGAGVRYHTPFGPIRLDAGYRVVENLPCIVVGGVCSDRPIPESPFALHFSIGEAF